MDISNKYTKLRDSLLIDVDSIPDEARKLVVDSIPEASKNVK